MSKNSGKSQKGGMSLCGTLTVIFIVLKILKVIEWSWIWVVSPMWIPIAIAIVLLIIDGLLN